jgi:hypothetical protein
VAQSALAHPRLVAKRLIAVGSPPGAALPTMRSSSPGKGQTKAQFGVLLCITGS